MGTAQPGRVGGRSHVATGLMAVVGTGVVVGLALGYSQRPAGLCVLAVAGLVVVLLCLTVLRGPLASLLATLAGKHGAHFVQGPVVRGGLGALLVLAALVGVLWPASLPWSLFGVLALLGTLAAIQVLRLHPEFGVRKASREHAKGQRWMWGGLSGLCAAWFMSLVPGQVVHALGGPVAESPIAMLANAIGDFESRIMARFDKQDETLEEQSEKLDRALAILERQESQLRTLSAGDASPPPPPPLSPEDRAILDAAKPLADTLTRYRIAVAQGDDVAAGELEEEVLRHREAKRTEEDFVFERARGDRHYNAGRYDEAILAYRAAKAAKPGDPAVLHRLSLALYQARRSDNYGNSLFEVERLLDQTLKITRVQHPGDHPNIGQILNNLATVCQALGRTAEAEFKYAEALGMYRRLFEGDHPDVATSIGGLAGVRRELGHFAEAERLHAEALDMRRRLFEEDHPDVANSICNLANVRHTLGRAAEAESMYAEALGMLRRLFERDHPSVAVVLTNLADVRLELGRVAEAEALHTEALGMFRRLFEGDHPHIAQSLIRLGATRQTLGRFTEAESLYAEALDMRRRLFEGDHPDIAQSLYSLAAGRRAMGSVNEAYLLCSEALSMYRRLYKGDHADVARTLDYLGSLQGRRGQLADAESLNAEALAMRRRLLPDNHLEIARSLNHLAVVKTRQNRWLEALPHLQEAVDIGRRGLAPDHPDLQEWEANLSIIESFLNG